MNLKQSIQLLIVGCVAFAFASCQTTSSHQFAQPTPAWKTRSGQLAYKGSNMSLIGEVLVRYSKTGDLELTFTKGPGVALLTLRQDAQFASAEGPLARGGWAGPTSSAPERLRGWFGLCEKIIAGTSSFQTSAGAESFNVRF